MIKVNIQLTFAGVDTGPFDIYAGGDSGFVFQFGGVSKALLQAGVEANVPDDTTVIRVVSTGICTNSVDTPINIIPPPTSTTTTTSSSTSTTTSTSSTTTTTTTAASSNSYEVKAGDILLDICSAPTITVYSATEDSWVEGTLLFMDAGLTTPINTDYIVLLSDGIVRNITLLALGAVTGDNCSVG